MTVSSALAQMLEQLPDGILLLDEQWRITFANRTACAISRLLPEHFHGPTHWEIFPETVGTPLQTAYNDVMQKRTERRVPSFFYAPFSVWLDVRVLPVEGGIALYYRDVTEQHNSDEARQASEEARQVSEERLGLALTAANGVGTWDWDVRNDRVYTDARFATVYGVDPGDAVEGVPIAEFTRNIHPDDLLTVGPAIEAAIADGTEFVAQYRIVQANGSLCWVSARGRCTHDASGAPLRFAGVIIDITDQKAREDELRSSEERYRVLTELSPQSLWSADPEGRVLYANRRFLSYIGKDFVPRDGDEYIRCFDEHDRERMLTAWGHSVSTGEDYALDARLLRASDGASRWWHLRAGPIRDEAGSIQQWLGTAIDIHEERLATDRLRAQYEEIDQRRRELETIYRGSPIGMALYEPNDLRLLRINDRQVEIFRLTNADEALGKPYLELAGGVDSAHSLIRRAAAGEAMLNQDIEGRLDRVPEEYRYWTISYSPIFDEEGRVQAIAAATVETTHQKRAEQALIQSEKLAAVGRMASSIAHEINNPLESVTNLIFIARSYAILPEVQNFLDLADQELRRVSIIANQTLRFHKQASSPREITCADLFATVLSLYEGRLRNSAIKLEKVKWAKRPIACFEGDIRQVLNNLVSNAIDSMPMGGRLLLRSREATDWKTGRKGIAMTVADTGKGISAETRARIFEAFFTTKGNQGTGLGLWISSEILERHGGCLHLRSSQSAERHGTVFSVFLPFQAILEIPFTSMIQ
jgi:PAS domain S-box-containing protein